MPNRTSIPRSLEFAIFLVGCIWLAAAHIAATVTARALGAHIGLDGAQTLLEQAFLLLLLLAGYLAISWTTLHTGTLRSIAGLPARPTARQEWLRGAALGWAMVLAATLPMMCAGDLHPVFSLRPVALAGTLTALTTVLLRSLAMQVAYRGFLLQRLIGSVGPTWATILVSLMVAVASALNPFSYTTLWSFAATFVLSVLLCVAYLRTHGLWLAWGLEFGFAAVTVVAFGLPLDGLAPAAAVVLNDTSGHTLLTGGPAGPLGAAFTLFLVLAALVPLYRMTRNYAWDYTQPEIVAAGYPMEVAPPAAHAAMEAAAAPAPLVQILGATPTAASTLPVIDEHLRRDPSGE